MADVKLIIDGKQVTVPAGTVVVEAARQAGVPIPVFCYHPKLVPVGMCRMCVVEVGTPKLGPDRQPVLDEQGAPVVQKMPKLQPACTTPVSEGMQVWTTGDEVEFAQRGVLEMLLMSHPLDCPVCDKGGECPLQNLTMQWGPGVSRMDYMDKIHFEKPIPLGDMIYLDRERCIQCSRCVRFQDEIAGDPVLGFDQRGRAWQIISKSDPPFDSKFSGNTTDICPVGALTTSDFRFKARVWELQPKATVCNHCPVGCNMAFDMRYDRVMRVMPRENEQVNELWICDRGRFGHRFIESDQRLTTPLLRRDGQLAPATWEEALTYIIRQLDGIRDSKGGAVIGGIAGPQLANEDLYAFQRLLRETLGSPHLDHRAGGPLDLPLDDMGAALGLAPGTNLGQLGKGTLVLVVGADPEEEAPVHLLRIKGIANRGGAIITLNPRATKLDRFAQLALRPRPGSEGQVLAAVARQVMDTAGESARKLRGAEELRASLGEASPQAASAASGVAEAQLAALASAIGGAENLVLVYGRDARAAGEGVLRAIANLLLLSGKSGRVGSGLLGLLAGANSRGAHDMGVRPDRGPGYAALAKPGMSARQMLAAAGENRLQAMYIVGSDPAAASPQAAEALGKLNLLIVQELFLTATAQLADVVLPAAAVAEREGTFTNAERRVQRFRQARTAPGQARPDWQIFQAIARELVQATVAVATSVGGDKRDRRDVVKQAAVAEEGWRYSSPAEIMGEIARRVPGYAGVTYRKLESTLEWPAEPTLAENKVQEPPPSRMLGGSLRWDRQVDDPLYYDGTAYKNIGGLGQQLPLAQVSYGLAAVRPGAEAARPATAERPWTLLPVTRLYDNSVLLTDSAPIAARAARAEAFISQADARQLGVASGDQLRLRSASGELTLPARISREAADGTVLVPLDVAGAVLSGLAEGQRTAVALEKVEG